MFAQTLTFELNDIDLNIWHAGSPLHYLGHVWRSRW